MTPLVETPAAAPPGALGADPHATRNDHIAALPGNGDRAAVTVTIFGSPAAAERRLMRATDRVHRLVAEIERDPTDDRVRQLAAAYEALRRTATDAAASGIEAARVADVVSAAHTACVRVAADVILPLVDPGEFDLEE